MAAKKLEETKKSHNSDEFVLIKQNKDDVGIVFVDFQKNPSILLRAIPFIMEHHCRFQINTTAWDSQSQEEEGIPLCKIPEARKIYLEAVLKYGLLGLIIYSKAAHINIDGEKMIDDLGIMCIEKEPIPASDGRMQYTINNIKLKNLILHSTKVFGQLYLPKP